MDLRLSPLNFNETGIGQNGLSQPRFRSHPLVWLAIAITIRCSSFSALVAALVISVALWILGAEEIAAVMAIMTLISWWKHKANIGRLMNGTETKIGAKG